MDGYSHCCCELTMVTGCFTFIVGGCLFFVPLSNLLVVVFVFTRCLCDFFAIASAGSLFFEFCFVAVVSFPYFPLFYVFCRFSIACSATGA